MTPRRLPFATESVAGLSAVVTGGSRGLGLLIAGELAARGCTVTLAARDADELERAAAGLHRAGAGNVRTAVCDVRERDQVDALFTSVAAECGSVDIVVANAGIIQVAPVAAIGAEEFDSAMRTIFEGALHTSLAGLPHLRPQRGGWPARPDRLGRWPARGAHLLPYSCVKSAVAALAEGLHAEEAAGGVTVTAVHPGLMRTGSHRHAEFGGDRGREFAWFSALAGTPLVSMDAERAAARIVEGVRRRRTRIVLTPAAKAADVLHGIAPATVTRLSGLAARALPDPPAGQSGLREGSKVTPPVSGLTERLRTWGSAWNDRASARFNQ